MLSNFDYKVIKSFVTKLQTAQKELRLFSFSFLSFRYRQLP